MIFPVPEYWINHGSISKPTSAHYYNYCYNKVTDWIDEMAQGRLTYTEYVKEVEEANNDLEKMKSGYSFVVIGQNELTEDLEWQEPSMWIRIDHQPVLDLTKEKSNGVGIKQ